MIVALADGAISVTPWVNGEDAARRPGRPAGELTKLSPSHHLPACEWWTTITPMSLPDDLAALAPPPWESGPYGERARGAVRGRLDAVADGRRPTTRWPTWRGASRGSSPTASPHQRNQLVTLETPFSWTGRPSASHRPSATGAASSSAACPRRAGRGHARPLRPRVAARRDQPVRRVVRCPHAGTASDRVAIGGLFHELTRAQFVTAGCHATCQFSAPNTPPPAQSRGDGPRPRRPRRPIARFPLDGRPRDGLVGAVDGVQQGDQRPVRGSGSWPSTSTPGARGVRHPRGRVARRPARAVEQAQHLVVAAFEDAALGEPAAQGLAESLAEPLDQALRRAFLLAHGRPRRRQHRVLRSGPSTATPWPSATATSSRPPRPCRRERARPGRRRRGRSGAAGSGLARLVVEQQEEESSAISVTKGPTVRRGTSLLK